METQTSIFEETSFRQTKGAHQRLQDSPIMYPLFSSTLNYSEDMVPGPKWSQLPLSRLKLVLKCQPLYVTIGIEIVVSAVVGCRAGVIVVAGHSR